MACKAEIGAIRLLLSLSTSCYIVQNVTQHEDEYPDEECSSSLDYRLYT